MERKRIIAGNWKMNLNFHQAKKLADEIVTIEIDKNHEVLLFPPSLYLKEIGLAVQSNKRISIGAQNCHFEDNGAFTGEISASMLKSININNVLIGHSERRMYFHEDSTMLLRKTLTALNQGLRVIFCCGEPLKERKSNNHFNYVSKQLKDAIFQLNSEQISSCIIAYEPIWAIGTGETASAEQAQEMHKHIRGLVSSKYGTSIANNIQILYGGSVKPANATSIFSKTDVDGGLIGGAALDADSFIEIIKA